MPEERTVSFEDPADLLCLLAASRLDVFRNVKGEPGSIVVIAGRLHRDRSPVKREVNWPDAHGHWLQFKVLFK